MQGEGGTPFSRLLAAIREFQARDDRRVDLKGLRAGIDALEAEFAGEALEAKSSGDHRIAGNISAASWLSQICGMSVPSAKDRLCVGQQLEPLPMVAEALSRGEITYQSASVMCHQRDKLGDKSECLDQEQCAGLAPQPPAKDPHW